MLEILVVSQVLQDPIFFDGFITNQFNVLLPVGLLSQLIERCTVIAEVKVSNPVQARIFFRYLFAAAKVASITVMISFHIKSQLVTLHSTIP